MPRIGMLIARFHPIEGGAEIQCRRLALELKTQGYSVFVLTRKTAQTLPFQILDGLPVHRIGPGFSGRFGSFWYLVSGYAWLVSRRKEFDVLHAHLASSPAILAALVSPVLKVPAVLKIAGTRATGDIGTSSRTWFGRLKLGFLKQRFAAFVCPSAEAKEEIVNAGFPGNKVVIIPNGVRTDLFAPVDAGGKAALRKTLGLPASGRLVLYTGRLEPGKGLETLIDAWKLAPAGTDAHLVILGTGSLEGALKTQAARNERIHFPGWKENAADYVKASDIFVLPSFGEGLPNSLLEAMSCGLACVATRIGGITELITHDKNGILVAPGDAATLAKEVSALIGDPGTRERLGRAARDYVVRNVSMETVAGRYADLYRTLARNGTPG